MGLLLAAVICVYPAIIFAYILVFKFIPPKYQVEESAAMTLFRR